MSEPVHGEDPQWTGVVLYTIEGAESPAYADVAGRTSVSDE